MVVSKDAIVSGTSEWIKWWVEQRKSKLEEELSSTMSVNPFMLPIVYELHSLKNFNQLGDLFIDSHLMTGHSTGFGKLIDEKILPNIFGTTKLDAKYRKDNPMFMNSCFDEVDHVVPRNGTVNDLLSLKASKWSIQLTMAVQLNASFNEIIKKFGNKCGKIVVGVIYGKTDDLTDKYDILRGINRGKKHNVTDITKRVVVYAGKDFWKWLNDGEPKTQEWLLEGILKGIREDDTMKECEKLLSDFKGRIKKKYSQYVKKNDEIDWVSLLKDVNG
jgi:hypothetical protein